MRFRKKIYNHDGIHVGYYGEHKTIHDVMEYLGLDRSI